MPFLLFAVPVLATLLGGALAVGGRRHLTLLTALGAGLLLGAAFLDLLPEALALGAAAGLPAASVLGLTLLSFLLFYAGQLGLEEVTSRWQATSSGRKGARRVGAAMLIFHSFRDGMAIGAAFTASHAAGYAVACGIAAHDLGDGMNTMILATGGERPTAADFGFLAADAVAPLLGGLLTVWWVLSPRVSVVLLVLAAGFFLQMATGDYLPELRETGSRKVLVPAVLLGVAMIYVANVLMERVQ